MQTPYNDPFVFALPSGSRGIDGLANARAHIEKRFGIRGGDCRLRGLQRDFALWEIRGYDYKPVSS